MVNSPPGRKRIPAGDSTEARLSVTRVISFAFGSRQMAGLICIACRLSSGGVTRIAAAKGGFLKRSVTIIDIAERRSEEHTSELQSLMRISYAVFCLKKKKTRNQDTTL